MAIPGARPPGPAKHPYAQPAKTPAEKQDSDKKPRRLIFGNKPWQGDFDRMIKRRIYKYYVAWWVPPISGMAAETRRPSRLGLTRFYYILWPPTQKGEQPY
jgi:hypothetical protein